MLECLCVEQAQPLFPQLLQRALELVSRCACASMSGCPSCTQHLGCTEYNAVLHKRAAIAILELTLEAEREHAGRMALQARPAAAVMLVWQGWDACAGS